jgi:hypothetical protein
MKTGTFGNNLSESEYLELAKQAAGNHRKFDSFAWFGRPDDDENWTLVYTSNRDSGPLDKANAEFIAAELSRFEGRTVRAESHSHWACGYVDGYAIKVYRADGKVTKAFKVWCDIKAALDDYPVLDESRMSELEQEEIDESWDNWIAYDFQRALERRFDVDDFDIDGDKLRAIFDDACNESSTYPEHTGSEVIVDIDRIVRVVTADMVREFAPVLPVRIFCDGYVLCDGELRCGEYTCDMSLYTAEFDACMEADDNGESSVTIDGKVYTWNIG